MFWKEFCFKVLELPGELLLAHAEAAFCYDLLANLVCGDSVEVFIEECFQLEDLRMIESDMDDGEDGCEELCWDEHPGLLSSQ